MFKDFTYNYKRIKVMKVVLIVMLSIILSAGSGCISKEEQREIKIISASL